jgi:Mor family transcriptional regulator
MARPRKIKYKCWVSFWKNVMGYSVNKLAKKYDCSKRTIWRYLK